MDLPTTSRFNSDFPQYLDALRFAPKPTLVLAISLPSGMSK